MTGPGAAVRAGGAVVEREGAAGSGPLESIHPVAERRVVSVLFADLVGFTALAAGRDPEAVRELLARYYDTASDIVTRYGGTIEKFIGDAVMAVWGTPVAYEDDAERSVRAALDLVESASAFGTSSEGAVRMRAAVLSGEAAVTIGAQGQGMVAGDLVNTASRLQAAADPGTVLVGEATRMAVGPSIHFEPAGSVELRGKAVPVPAFRALRVVGDLRGAGRTELLEPPFVGRAEQLALLRELFHATGRERRPRLVSVIGLSGIGKTRLAWELEKYLDGVVEEVYWHTGRSPAYGEGITFWALAEMIRRRAGLAEGDDERTTRSAIGTMLADLVPDADERRWIESRLLPVLGIGDVPPGGRDELFAAWRTFFERIAARGSTALVFEDLQWADDGLLDFIEHLLDWARDLPVFVLTLARPDLLERRPGWGIEQRNAVSVRLEPLHPDAMRALLAGLVPGLPEAAVAAVLARADGIPLYAVETVRMLVSDGRLVEDSGRYRPTADLTTLEVPASLHALVAARLDALDPADRSLVHDASVLGQRFTPEALAAVAGRSAAEIEPRLRALMRREVFVHETDPRSPERGQYGFVQAITREVAYATLARRDRRARHLAAARYFESLGEGALAGALAMQYLAAWEAVPDGQEGEAIRTQARLALRAAADRAASLGSLAQAIAFLRQARTVTTDPADDADLLDAIAMLGSSGGYFPEAIDASRAEADLARRIGDPRGVVRASRALGHALVSASRIAEALEVLEPAVSDAMALDDHAVAASFSEVLSRAYFRADRMSEAIDWADRTVARGEPLGLDEQVSLALITKGTAMIGLGHRREGLSLLDGVARYAELRGLHYEALRAGNNIAAFSLDLDPAGALVRAREGLELAHRLGQRAFDLYQLGNACAAAEHTGDWDWFVSVTQEAIDATNDQGSRAYLGACLASVACWRGGDYGAVLADLRGWAAASEDPQVRLQADSVATRIAFLAGRYSDGHRSGMLGAGGGFESWLEIALAGRCALHGGDAAAAGETLLEMDRGPQGGAVEANRTMLRAGIAALEGRTAESITAYRQALARYRELGLRFDVALLGLDMATLLDPDDPEVRAAAEESLVILRGLEAAPLLDLLGRKLGREPGRRPELTTRHEAGGQAG